MTEGLCVVYANLKEKNLAGKPSNGMVMCASDEAKTKFEMVKPPAGAKVGERI
jgi:aminoacyl tRNA synthase complex-interacting multifunctional protein 1